MREVDLVKKLNKSYTKLQLKYSKLIIAFCLMVLTAILEMAGLSLLYPIMLIMLNNPEQPSTVLSFLPFSYSTNILLLFIGVSFLYVLKNVILYFSYSYNISFARYYYINLIRGLYEVYVHKPLLEFRKESAGSLANIICVQSGKLVDGVLRPLLVVVTELFILLGISILVFLISPLLIMALIVVCGGAATLYYLLFRARALQWGKTSMEALSNLQELVSNTSLGIMEIKIFGKENFLTSKVHETSLIETNMFHNLEMYQQAPRFLIETVFTVTLLLFLSIAFFVGQDTSVLIAKFSVFAAAAFRILPSINRLVNSYSNFSFHVGPALSLMDTLAQLDLIPETSKLKAEVVKESELFSADKIELKSVSFNYPSQTQTMILNNINLLINKGQKIGIMGNSGSGKSTLVKILAGLQVPLSGSVMVDNRDIFQHGQLKTWQKHIGYVPQDSFIMPGSVRENISFGSNLASLDEEIWEILEKIGFAQFLRSLSQQLDTKIGEKGMILSGGQKQLICLSRALFRKPKLLLLDEPTASLDAYNEQMVLKAIQNLDADTTVLMVSHKLENFINFDVTYRCERANLYQQEIMENVKQNVL